MPQKPEEVREEIVKEFGGLAGGSPFLDDFAAIGSFLSNSEKVRQEALKLEKRLQETLRTRFNTMFRQEEERKDPVGYAQKYFAMHAERAKGKSPTDVDCSHLLSGELSRLEAQCGFQHTQMPIILFGEDQFKPVDILVGRISAEKFLQQVVERRHWKDPGAGARHGEYTHRLQWYFVVASGILTMNPADVFAAVAAVYTGDPRQEDKKDFKTLWDFLVDRTPTEGTFPAQNSRDFRSPENLNLWLIEQTVEMPLLSSFLDARAKKRATYNIMDYLASKLFPPAKSYAELSPGNKKKVDEAASRAAINMDYVIKRG